MERGLGVREDLALVIEREGRGRGDGDRKGTEEVAGLATVGLRVGRLEVGR